MAAHNNRQQPNYQRIDNILQVNDDCLFAILQNLSLIELCDAAETCKWLRHVAREVFVRVYARRSKCYLIDKKAFNFKNHSRILRNFGNLIRSAFVNVFLHGDSILSAKEIVQAFNCLDRYCGDTLQDLYIIDLPRDTSHPPTDLATAFLTPSAKRLMAKMRTINIFTNACVDNEIVRILFSDCKKLVQLHLPQCDFFFTDHRYPNLLQLSLDMQVDYGTDFQKMKTFFKIHSKLIELKIKFNVNSERRKDCTIDLSFIACLANLKTLHLTGLCGVKIIGVNAFANLKKLKKLSIDYSDNCRTDASILQNLASIDSLLKLEFGFSGINHLVAGIDNIRNLSELSITRGWIGCYNEFNISIACLAQLKNSPLTKLTIECRKLLEPETIVDVIRNLREVKIMECKCEIELTESMCKRLATFCSSQNRKVEIRISNGRFPRRKDFGSDFTFIDKFNREHGQFVEIKLILD